MNSFIVPAITYEAQNAYRRLQMNLTLDDPKTALIEIKTFLKIYPDVAMACNDLGVLYLQMGEKLLALACYEKANRIQPENPTIVKNLAEFYFAELGWTDDAIMMLTNLLHSYPDDNELLKLLGVISERIGREDEARTFFGKVAELDPYDTQARDALTRLGMASAAAPGFSPAPPRQEQVWQSPAPAPQSPQPQVVVPPSPVAPPQETPAASGGLDDVLARLRATLNAPSAASATPLAPASSIDDLYREAQGYAAAGDGDRAIATLERVVALNPAHDLAHNDLGVLYSQLGDVDKAQSHYNAALSRNPNNPVFRKNMAELCYACLGKTDEAIAIYTGLLREFPTDIDVLTALAIISKANNLQEQARVFISKVLDLEPWNRDAREFLATL